MQQQCKVVMLPTNKESKLAITQKIDEKSELSISILQKSVNNGMGMFIYGYIKPKYQHLYILSDDEIKEDDWCYTDKSIGKVLENFGNNLCEVDISWSTTQTRSACEKIIATTDESLGLNDIFNLQERFPQPSQSFIEKYVKEYNKGNVIIDVLVEYEASMKLHKGEIPDKSYPEGFDELTLKVNPRDNTININVIKDSWSREEVKDKIRQLQHSIDRGDVKNIADWIEQNL